MEIVTEAPEGVRSRDHKAGSTVKRELFLTSEPAHSEKPYIWTNERRVSEIVSKMRAAQPPEHSAAVYMRKSGEYHNDLRDLGPQAERARYYHARAALDEGRRDRASSPKFD